jgi:hypothetical protein
MARQVCRCAFAILLVGLPALAADEAKKTDDKDTDRKAVKSPLAPQERKEPKYQPVSKVTGTLGKVDQSERTLSIRVGRQTVEFALADDVKVRTSIMPVERDEKGKPKRLTSEEKHKLKGDDPKLPGYTAELSGLQRGQVVEVYLSRLKGSPTKKAAAGEKDKTASTDKTSPKDKGKDQNKSIDHEVLVTMIVIVSEPPPGRSNGR